MDPELAKKNQNIIKKLWELHHIAFQKKDKKLLAVIDVAIQLAHGASEEQTLAIFNDHLLQKYIERNKK